MKQSSYGTGGTRRDPMDAADQLAAIVNSSDDAIIGKTVDGVITTWNPAAERMYGYAAEEIIGQPITVLCPPDRVAELQEILRKIGNGERVPYHETVRQRKDGTVFPVSVAISPVHDDRHGLIGASSIARDISERYRLQAELRLRTDDLEIAYRDLETFSYSVSHDLRAPLRAMGALSGALLEDCGDEERLILAARCPRRLDRGIIMSLAEVLAAEYRLAYQVGPVTMLKAVTAQLSVVGDLTREAHAPLRGEVLGIAGQYAHFAGWLNANAGRLADAGACLDRALGWTAEGGEADMTATTLNLKAYVAWLGGKVGPMIGLSQAAQRSTSTSAGVRALAVQLEARGNALTGDGDNANRKLDERPA